MAQFKAIDGFNSMDTKELTGYLYQLNEQLKYMFNNLTPEDNYSNQALQKYLEDEKRVASLKFDLDGLKVEVSDFEKNTNAKFEVTDSKIDMKVTKGTVSSEISLESGQVTISGNRLVVNSTNFKLDASGNATFSGNVKVQRSLVQESAARVEHLKLMKTRFISEDSIRLIPAWDNI